jgi:hypothetical protein
MSIDEPFDSKTMEARIQSTFAFSRSVEEEMLLRPAKVARRQSVAGKLPVMKISMTADNRQASIDAYDTFRTIKGTQLGKSTSPSDAYIGLVEVVKFAVAYRADLLEAHTDLRRADTKVAQLMLENRQLRAANLALYLPRASPPSTPSKGSAAEATLPASPPSADSPCSPPSVVSSHMSPVPSWSPLERILFPVPSPVNDPPAKACNECRHEKKVNPAL